LKLKKKTKRIKIYFICQEREKNEKMIVDDNPTTISRYAPLYVEEDTVAHLKRQQKAKFGHRVASQALPAWRGHHPFADT
jgi:hypothetical protein